MKKSILLLAFGAFLISFVSVAQGKISGNGNVITENRNTSDYDAIKIAGSFDVDLVSGKEGIITLKGEENLLSAITVEVENNALRIFVDRGTQIRPSSGKKIQITVPYDKISQVALAGSGDIHSKDIIKSDSFSAKIAGSGTLNLSIDSNTLDISVSGSGDVILKGSTDNFSAKLAGSGNINASALKSKTVEANVSGSGNSIVSCNENLVARVAGSGNIKYLGNPEKRDVKITGSGNITKG